VGQVSRAHVFPRIWSRDSVGPLTRSAEDAALVYTCIQGTDVLDTTTHGVQPQDVLSGLRDGVTGLRLAFAETVFWDDTDPEILTAQAQAVLADMQVAAIKIGLIGAVEQIQAIASLLQSHPGIPVVLDPVLAAGGGANLSSSSLIDELKSSLLPLILLMTPNRAEARRLSNQEDADLAAQWLADSYKAGVLLTGADEAQGRMVTNRLYQFNKEPEAYSWPRLSGHYHGSGCTLASAIAARLALGEAINMAAKRGQAYTWQTLGSAEPLGKGQLIPRRIQT